MNRSLWFLVFLVLLALPPAVFAQDLAHQPTAFTAWLDFSKQPRELPIWIERVEHQVIPADSTQPAQNIYRIRFRRFAGLVDEVLMRVYFQDIQGQQPVFTAWNEIGRQVIQSGTLGQGLGMPSSETLQIPMANVDYVEIETQGEIPTVRGALALALRKAETREGLDFGGTGAITDPFGAATPSVTGTDDVYLFGRVKATLEPGVVPLAAGEVAGQSAEFDFPLERPPLIALLTFEILNADIAAPPHLSVNGADAGPVNLTVTDLADPALTGDIEAGRADAVYRYGGWLKCQKVIPGSLLIAGTNQLLITNPANPAPVALRSIEMQLKYTSDASTP